MLQKKAVFEPYDTQTIMYYHILSPLAIHISTPPEAPRPRDHGNPAGIGQRVDVNTGCRGSTFCQASERPW